MTLTVRFMTETSLARYFAVDGDRKVGRTVTVYYRASYDVWACLTCSAKGADASLACAHVAAARAADAHRPSEVTA